MEFIILQSVFIWHVCFNSIVVLYGTSHIQASNFHILFLQVSTQNIINFIPIDMHLYKQIPLEQHFEGLRLKVSHLWTDLKTSTAIFILDPPIPFFLVILFTFSSLILISCYCFTVPEEPIATYTRVVSIFPLAISSKFIHK